MSDLRFMAVVVFALAFPVGRISRSMAAAPPASATVATAPDGSAQANVRLVAPPPNRSPIDSELIRHPTGADSGAGTSAAHHSEGLELSRVGLALAIVIGLIFALRWGGKKLFGSAIAGHSTRAIQVLARSPVSPRQSILLVRVGRRVIVVGDGGAQMNPLAEITDPDEVASLIGQVRDDQPGHSAGAFGKLFQRAANDINVSEHEAADMRDESSDFSESTPGEGPIDPAIHETREELTGLMEKIRSLSQNFPPRSA